MCCAVLSYVLIPGHAILALFWGFHTSWNPFFPWRCFLILGSLHSLDRTLPDNHSLPRVLGLQPVLGASVDFGFSSMYHTIETIFPTFTLLMVYLQSPAHGWRQTHCRGSAFLQQGRIGILHMLQVLWSFPYTLQSQRYYPKGSGLNWTMRKVRQREACWWRVLYSWLSNLEWPSRPFAVPANQPVTLNRQLLDSNKLQALSPSYHDNRASRWWMVLIDWQTPGVLALSPFPLSHLHTHGTETVSSFWFCPDFEFPLLTSLKIVSYVKGKIWDRIWILPRTTLSSTGNLT